MARYIENLHQRLKMVRQLLTCDGAILITFNRETERVILSALTLTDDDVRHGRVVLETLSGYKAHSEQVEKLSDLLAPPQ